MPIVDPEAAEQFPDPLDRVEIGAVGWEEMQVEGAIVLPPP